MGDGIVIAVLGFACLSALLFFATSAGRKAQYPAAENVVAPATSGSGWSMAGLIFGIAGACGLLFSLSMETSIATDADLLPSSVVNLDMMHRQSIALALSLFAIGAGLFCAAVGAIIGAIGRE